MCYLHCSSLALDCSWSPGLGSSQSGYTRWMGVWLCRPVSLEPTFWRSQAQQSFSLNFNRFLKTSLVGGYSLTDVVQRHDRDRTTSDVRPTANTPCSPPSRMWSVTLRVFHKSATNTASDLQKWGLVLYKFGTGAALTSFFHFPLFSAVALRVQWWTIM